jgi:hypothetical protein
MAMTRCQLIPFPETPVERLGAKLGSVLHLPDPSVLYTLMGAVAANLIEGPPVWLMLVGPPSCGKSELLNSLLDIPRVFEVAEISGEAAFLSGSPRKDVVTDATGGLLRQVGPHGGLVLNDFTSVLSKPLDKINSIMAVFRESFGGRWTRNIGGEGGRPIHWAGKLALFAGVTGKIDQSHQVSAELGERWIYCRYEPLPDQFQACMMALTRRADFREFLKTTVARFFTELGLAFTRPIPRREYTLSEKVKLHKLASLAARCRSGVTRDAYNRDKEIVGTKEEELETRLCTVLSQLLIGMDYIGVPEAMRWKLLAKVAMDSMPRLRRLIIAAACKAPTFQALQAQLGCSLAVVKRAAEDLSVHGIVTVTGERIALSPWMEESYRRFFP